MEVVSAQVQGTADRHAALTVTIQYTRNATRTLKEQESLLAQLRSQEGRSRKRLKHLDAKRKEELRDSPQWRSSRVKRLAFSAVGKRSTFQSMVDKEERETHDRNRNYDKEQVLHDQLTAKILATEQALPELRKQVDLSRDAQIELDILYESVFRGPTLGFHREQQHQQLSNQTLQDYHDTEVQLTEMRRITELITQTGDLLKESLDQVNAILLAHDSGAPRRGQDWITIQVDTAKHSLAGAHQTYARANELFPSLEDMLLVDLEIEDAPRRSSDPDSSAWVASTREKLGRAKMDLTKCAALVRSQRDGSAGRRDILQRQLAQRGRVLEEARLDLQRIRREIFEGILRRGTVDEVMNVGVTGEELPSYTP